MEMNSRAFLYMSAPKAPGAGKRDSALAVSVLADYPIYSRADGNSRPRCDTDNDIENLIQRQLPPTNRHKFQQCYLSNLRRYAIQHGFRLRDSPSDESIICYSREDTIINAPFNHIIILSRDNAIDSDLMEPGRHGFTYSTSLLGRKVPAGEPFSLFTVQEDHILIYHGQYIWLDHHSPAVMHGHRSWSLLSSEAWRTLSRRQRQILIEIDTAERRTGTVSARAADDVNVQPRLHLYIFENQGYNQSLVSDIRALGKPDAKGPWLKQVRSGMGKIFK